ncbi:MarR family winged helix-turn-helix transcriptional regulator [Myceligenerans xiligouense]|uniref:MarR family transcriptional regulator n=1 Tax=Myceligenerans xiligouense TaxID=253184 RepID=A0A3N4YMC5_9MICO|nr:MarR family transcriptional regulator [Myceligenerans xiligouense]RPF22229.1 MarR family transcriptional regulator [Myceligenerans xiligouense]
MTFQVARMNEQESAAWLGLVTVCQLLPAALDSQLKQDSGMTHFEFSVLSVLRFAPDHTLRMTALAETTSSTLPRLSHVCSRLEKRGLTDRFPCPEDGRATNVRLTPEGRNALVRAMPGHIDTARRLVVDALTPEQLDALAQVTAVIRGQLDDGRPARGNPFA